MKKLLYSIILLCSIVSPIRYLEAEAPVIGIPPKPLTIEEKFVKYATVYGVEAKQMLETAKCESSLNPKALNHTSREYSVGIAQINLKAHTDVSIAQAQDTDFAIDFMAKEFKKGNAKIWSCYKKLYK